MGYIVTSGGTEHRHPGRYMYVKNTGPFGRGYESPDAAWDAFHGPLIAREQARLEQAFQEAVKLHLWRLSQPHLADLETGRHCPRRSDFSGVPLYGPLEYHPETSTNLERSTMAAYVRMVLIVTLPGC